MANANLKKYRTWIKNFSFLRMDSGGDPVIEWRTAGAALAKGVPVVMTTSFLQEVAAGTGTVVYGVTAAAAAASGAVIPVICATNDTVFVGQNDALGAGTFLDFPHYALFSGTTSVAVVAATTAGTYHQLTVLGNMGGDNLADTVYFNRVYFKFPQSQYEGMPGAAAL